MACGLFWGKSTRVEASDKKKIPCRCKRVVKIRRMGVHTFRPAHQTSKESQTHVENKNNTIGRDFRIQLEGTFECNWKRLHVLEHLWEASDRCNHDFSTHANLPCAINDPALVVRGGSCVCGGVQQDRTKPSRAESPHWPQHALALQPTRHHHRQIPRSTPRLAGGGRAVGMARRRHRGQCGP
jgi:hypothetical protein